MNSGGAVMSGLKDQQAKAEKRQDAQLKTEEELSVRVQTKMQETTVVKKGIQSSLQEREVELQSTSKIAVERKTKVLTMKQL